MSMKNVIILMSNSYDAIFSNLSMYTKSITIGLKFDEGVVKGSIDTLDESSVCLRKNEKYITNYPDIIAIKKFNLNILGGILSTIDRKIDVTPQQKLFWIYTNYLFINGFKRIFELSDYYKNMIYGYFEFAKENPIPYTSKYPLLNITSRVKLHEEILNEIITNKKSSWIRKGKKTVENLKKQIETSHVQSNKKVLLRFSRNLNKNIFYNPNEEFSNMTINYDKEKKTFNLLYAFDIQDKNSIIISILHEFFRTYHKTSEFYDKSKIPQEFIRVVFKEVKFELEDVQELFQFITYNKIKR